MPHRSLCLLQNIIASCVFLSLPSLLYHTLACTFCVSADQSRESEMGQWKEGEHNKQGGEKHRVRSEEPLQCMLRGAMFKALTSQVLCWSSLCRAGCVCAGGLLSVSIDCRSMALRSNWKANIVQHIPGITSYCSNKYAILQCLFLVRLCCSH